MIKVKYRYCLNENNELVHISSVSVENRHSHTFYCLECGQPLIAKIGKIKVPHFAHRAKTTCNGESYLHKLAKRRIREKFMSADSFPITFVRDVPCIESGKCPCFEEGYCSERDVNIPNDLRTCKGNVIYDTCQEEVRVGEFQPDLLLTCSTKPERKCVFIEVYKTHESEEPKVNSDYRIIETMKIKTEADIDDIIERGFVEGQNCRTFNFSPKLPPIKKKVPIDRFVLFRSGAATIYRAKDDIVKCDKLNQKVQPNSIAELNMKRGINIWGDLVANNKFDSFQQGLGLVYLVKKGLSIKNCILCKFYKYERSACSLLYKTMEWGKMSSQPRQLMVNKCPWYELNQELMSHSLSELKEVLSEVPI